jgi:hypothetical protein
MSIAESRKIINSGNPEENDGCDFHLNDIQYNKKWGGAKK